MSIEQLTQEQRSKYIILESEDTRLLVAKNRLSYDKEVEEAAKILGFKVSNTAKEKKGHPYIGNINHKQALKLNLVLDSTTLPVGKFLEFYKLLKKGSKGKVNVYDGNGKNLDAKEISDIFDEIAGIREPYRGEYLENSFHKIGDDLCIASDFEIKEDKLGPRKLEILEDCVMENCFVDLNSLNKQGLPTRKSKKSEKGGVYFYYPADNSVAWFDAHVDRAALSCFRDPLNSYADLGIRRAKIFQ